MFNCYCQLSEKAHKSIVEQAWLCLPVLPIRRKETSTAWKSAKHGADISTGPDTVLGGA